MLDDAEAPSSLADLKVISLFSGIGGLDLGFARHGVRSAAYLEIDKACCATLNANRHILGHHDDDVAPLDITRVKPSDFYSGAVDLIIGGPPCQSFSAAGRRAGGVSGTDDARGSLFWYYCRYVEHFRPKAFVFENVRGILSSNGGRDWELIKASFSALGYRLDWRVLNAADYGTPQHRERLFLIGTRSDLGLQMRFPRPTYGPDSVSLRPYVTAGMALADIGNDDEHVPPYGGKYGHLLAAIPPGENYRHFTEEMGHPNPVFAWRSKFSGFLYKLSPDEVSKTIVAQQGQYDGPFHWRNRKCTVQELQRLQGFPDNLLLPHGHTIAARQIGNSVAPPVAEALAGAVLRQLGYAVETQVELIEESRALSFDRRKRERAIKVRSRRASTTELFGQQDFFSPMDLSGLVTINKEARRPGLSGSYAELIDITDGLGHIHLLGDDSSSTSMSFAVTFRGQVSRRLRTVTCSINEVSLDAYFACWQSLHELVANTTSFASMAPLYGHFTEPHPKFSLCANVVGEGAVAAFVRVISDPRFTSKTHQLSWLRTLDIDNPEEFLKSARRFGIDARTNNTNRTIPAGQFRICYPFAVPTSERQFVSWTDSGDYKKNDFVLSDLAKQSCP